MFGFHILDINFFGYILQPLDGLVGSLNVSELTFEQVVNILAVSVAIGFIHLLLAMFLKLRADILERNKLAVLTHVYFYTEPRIFFHSDNHILQSHRKVSIG